MTKQVLDLNGVEIAVSLDTPCHPAKNGILPRLYTQEEQDVIVAEQAVLKAQWDAEEVERNAKIEIKHLEEQITPRRIRDKLFNTENPDNWLANQEALIAIERAKF